FFPPDVSGWAGGPAWLTSAGLIDRQNLAAEAASGDGRFTRLDPARLAEERGLTEPEELCGFFLNHFLQDPNHPAGETLAEELRTMASEAGSFTPSRLTVARMARRAAETALRLPEYQLA
ncbi:MAG: DUF1800 family protein, partial [Planctomycetota bacterium]